MLCSDRRLPRIRSSVRNLISKLAALLAVTPAAAEGQIPEEFVYLRDVAPGIVQEMRYAGPNNFTRHKLPGYEAAECVLKRGAAEALARVQEDLVRNGLSLKVYDCYRPQRAVAAMLNWVTNGEDVRNRFHPRVARRRLVVLGYIAARSTHSLGTAVDVTLMEKMQRPAEMRVVQGPAPCTAPATERARDDSVDMGTEFDCFDIKSHVKATGLTAAQRTWRRRLQEAMSRHGFKGYAREWWHFSWGDSNSPEPQDFSILPRNKQSSREWRP